MRSLRQLKAHTFIELLIVLAIVGVLAAIALPSYQGSVIPGYRVVAQAGLMDLSNRQVQFHLNNKIYTADMTNLGYPAASVFTEGGDSAVALDANQNIVASTASDRIYIIKIDSASATAFSVSAVPQLGQAGDTDCGTLTLDNTGAQTESGTATVADCW